MVHNFLQSWQVTLLQHMHLCGNDDCSFQQSDDWQSEILKRSNFLNVTKFWRNWHLEWSPEVILIQYNSSCIQTVIIFLFIYFTQSLSVVVAVDFTSHNTSLISWRHAQRCRWRVERDLASDVVVACICTSRWNKLHPELIAGCLFFCYESATHSTTPDWCFDSGRLQPDEKPPGRRWFAAVSLMLASLQPCWKPLAAVDHRHIMVGVWLMAVHAPPNSI